jgi:hypothetical protein
MIINIIIKDKNKMFLFIIFILSLTNKIFIIIILYNINQHIFRYIIRIFLILFNIFINILNIHTIKLILIEYIII